MCSAKITLVAFALVAGLVCVQAAGGIKGRQPAEAQQRVQAIKGPVARPPIQQQTYLPPPAPLPVAVPVQAIKAGPGQVAPVFQAARVQPFQQQPFQQQPIQQQQEQQQQQQQPEPEIVQQQQQQQEEVDPNAAAQDSAPAVLAPAQPAAAAAAASEEEANPRPEPYSFQYAFESGDSATAGSSVREEQQDANGRVTGFYTLKGEDGRDRRVDYVADASGFRATISTNELGTAPKDSADGKFLVQAATQQQLVQRAPLQLVAQPQLVQVPLVRQPQLWVQQERQQWSQQVAEPAESIESIVQQQQQQEEISRSS